MAPTKIPSEPIILLRAMNIATRDLCRAIAVGDMEVVTPLFQERVRLYERTFDAFLALEQAYEKAQVNRLSDKKLLKIISGAITTEFKRAHEMDPDYAASDVWHGKGAVAVLDALRAKGVL